jgi:NADPH:quinone reductase-like Zn-dependent oxidoreductase
MKAAFADRYGPPDLVQVREIDRPTPTGEEVLVRIRAASVNRADLDGLGPRPGFVRPFIGLRAPRNTRMGIDAAGVVEAVGPDAKRFKPGDQVFADLFGSDQGAFSEYVAIPEKKFQAMPAGMSFEDAATLPHSAVLALQGLRLRNGRTPKPGDKVLIDGASGNVGPFAVQIAKALGAEVTGVASTDKLDMVRALGVDHVLDYRKVDYTREKERYDWIVDTDSHHPILGVRRALKPGGAYVSLGGTAWPIIRNLFAGPLLSMFSDRWAGLMIWWKPFNPPDVDRLKELIAAGQLRPVIDRRYPLTEVVDALRHVNDGHARGKVVITMDGPGEPPGT